MCMKETPDGVDERRLERTSIQLGKLLEGIRNRGAAFTVVILDACRLCARDAWYPGRILLWSRRV